MATTLALLSGLALAGHGTMLEIDNRFDGEAEVWVDGRFEGRVPGDARARFDVKPGRRDVEVRRPGTGYPLADMRLHFPSGGLVMLPVEAPAGTLRVQNAGEVALRLQAEDATVWVQPGTTVSLPVESGYLPITASIKEPRGEFETIQRTLWVEPGQPALEVLRPDPTVLTIVNRDMVAVHVHLDGQDAGMLAPGATRVLYVRPGTSRVTLVDPLGRARLAQVVDLPRGEQARIVLSAPPPPTPVRTVVVTPSRPLPPHRWHHH